MDLKDVEILHTYNESVDENNKKNKTDFVKKSIGAYGYELVSEDINDRWSQIASDVFKQKE